MASAKIPLLEEAVPFEEDDINHQDETFVERLSHPYVTFFHIIFRAAALATYLFCGWFSNSFISNFVIVVLLLSADFWTVKNITGRLLVGLRWWNYVDDNGVSHWIFESRSENNTAKLNPHESRIFWIGLMTCPIVWAFLFTVALFGFNFKWLLLVLIALVLNGANLYGYIKCNFGASANLSSTTTDFVKSQVLKNAVNLMTSQGRNDDAKGSAKSYRLNNAKNVDMI